MPRSGNKKKRSPAPAPTSKNLTAKKKPSPDSVVCIDLTTSSTMDDYLIRPETEQRLGSVRKELEPPSATKSKKRAGLKTTGLENTDWDEVIVIDSDEEEEEDTPMTDADGSIIVVDNAAVAVASRPTKKAKVKKEMDSSLSSRKKKDDDKMDNGDVEIVEATAPKLAAATMVADSSKNTTSGDDDVVVEGVVNETRLPHMRQHCTRYPFTFVSPSVSSYAFKRISTVNKQSCELCYCYVCDCPVKDCEHWHSHKTSKAESNHCSASEKYGTWDKMRSREKKKREKANTTTTAAAAAAAATTTTTDSADGENERTDDDPPAGYHFMQDCQEMRYAYLGNCTCTYCWCYICDDVGANCIDTYVHKSALPTDEYSRAERQRRKLSTYGLPGPFEPDNSDARKDPSLTKCRHCSWYSRLQSYRTSPSSDDWCTFCGRVASEKDLGKVQRNSKDSKTDQNDESYFVGEKDVPFRIHAHDPRLFEEYKENWGGDGSEWRYDDAEREEEVFLHRLGKLPLISSVLSLIPKVVKENIPKTSEGPESSLSHRTPRKSSLRDATDAVIIDDPEQLQFVTLISLIAERISNFIEIDASWNKESRSGLFKIRLTIPKYAFLGPNYRTENHLPILVGLWFGIFPLQPSEICGVLEATCFEGIIEGVEDEFFNQKVEIHVNPFALECNDAVNRLVEKLPSRVDSISSAKSVNESRLTLAPSNGCKFSGGVCAPASLNPLHDSIARYYSQNFMSLMPGECRTNDLVASCVGATRAKNFKFTDAILGFETSVAAEFCLFNHAEDWRYRLSNPSIKDIMTRVENLGHEPEDCVEGLKIELLDFQRQSLKWALEREQTPGGVQSFFWPKLPAREGQEDLYFSPMLKLFRKDKPALVRGGFIAEEMGLGKTVISLALILKNPAPEFPLSGSSISELKKKNPSNGTSKKLGWEKNLYKKTSIRNKKTGSVISRGTLVICPVSLVGQWIDEARSKLEEPGLVYPYHGSGRKRVPKILAENSIVVTTYDVVSSDASYQKNKAGTADYCPPLQQVRWWRIICDEGHILRQANTVRSYAVSSLVADHKWIVTGTPMNTSHLDLKNQLRFLGFEHIDKIFSKLTQSSHRGKEVNAENLLYFLRPIMMRHSQGQKYKGTSTTLMSLPPKTERKELISFSAGEKKEFQKLEKEAQDWYINFRSANLSKISSHFLKISSKLTPLRIACSGGKYPIHSQNITNDDAAIEDDGEEKKPAVSVYSKFEFKSKFNALLRQLKKIRDEEPDSKSLVFSQFSSTLDWLKVELPKNGFQFRTLSGDMTMKKRAKALSEFQNDPPTTIFLLSMRAGAVGINLTQANRVFLMEPSFNPALEAQAIGRVHRLGQKRPVEIVRLIVKNSFEERMINFLEEKYGGRSGKKPKDTPGKNQKKDSSDDTKDDEIQCIDIAGNLKTDKAQLVAAEFDTLFGVKDRLLKEESTEDDVKTGSM